MIKIILRFNVLFLLCFLFINKSLANGTSQEDCLYNKSWIFVDVSDKDRKLVSGQKWQVPVEYYLDPSEHFGTTFLYIWGAGPWIEVPDGKYATKKGHIGYSGVSSQIKLTKAGRGRHVFTLTVPQDIELVKKNNPIFILAGFRDSSGSDWPWRIRSGANFISNRGYFEIETDVPGNLFTYDDPVEIQIVSKNINQTGERKVLNYEVFDTSGTSVLQGQKEFVTKQDDNQITIYPDITQRGVFLIEIDIPGWEKRSTTFARIPDLRTITQGQPANFGITNSYGIQDEEIWAIAQRLGFSICRRFTRWYTIQPGPDFYNLDKLEEELETAARYNFKVWLCIVNPPSFAFTKKVENANYRTFDCNWEIWEDFVRTTTTRLKGKFYGWEWFNEITPAENENPVDTYLEICRIGTQTAKAIDPEITTILAGGLFPRSFRNQVLAAGVGKYIDVLPVHYQNGDGILEARRDLDAAGLKNVAVWDNESSKNVNAWAVPPLEELQNTEQCNWVLNQWADELTAGCEKIIYFGGESSPSGDFAYLLDDYSPRPVAATLAVFISKLASAKPLGVFLLGNGGLFHLFEKNGKPILLASTYEKDGEKLNLNTGTDNIVVTDYQGNETFLTSSKGKAELQLKQLRCFIEGADLDILKAYIVPRFQVSGVSAGTSNSVDATRRIIPRYSMLKNNKNKLLVNLNNIYNRELSGEITIEQPDGWPAANSIPFNLEAGQTENKEIIINIPDSAQDKAYEIKVSFKYDWDKLPTIEKPAVLSVISPENLGNLMPNGDFESPQKPGQNPEGWRLKNSKITRISSEDLGEGLGDYVIKFQNSEGWQYIYRNLKLQAGQTYLYTAWVRNENMGSGSNMLQFLEDGTQIQLYDTQVFSCGSNNPDWQMFSCLKQMPIGTEQVRFTPVANGKGWAMWDNIRVTVYEGTDYAAESYKTTKTPRIDGILDEDEWITKCPIPLIGRNQLTQISDTYQWTPDNLYGIVYLMWDEQNLYIACQVRDDQHYATGTESTTEQDFIEGDSIILGIDPTRRGPDCESKAFAYYISSSLPGGGSGKHTIIRPEIHSGNRTSGHLFKDSSVYNLAIEQKQGMCTYELCIPLTEIGLIGETGTKAGLSIQLNDSDGSGKAAQMNWGEGLYPTWSPETFGIVTFVQ